MVVTVHISGMVHAEWAHPYWWAGNLYDAFGQLGVPIFLMITGALFLPRDEGAWRFWQKRAFRLLPPTVFWACAYMWWSGIAVGDWPARVLSVQPEYFHLWFLYTLVPLSLAVPILSAFYRASSPGDRVYYVLLWLLFSIATTTLRVSANLGSSQGADLLNLFGLYIPAGYAGYLFVGAWIWQSRITRAGYFAALSATVVGLSGLVLTTYFLSAAGGKADIRYLNYLTPFVAAGGIGCFAVVRSFPIRETRVLRWLSDCSLGVYVLHLALIREVAKFGINGTAGNSWLTIPYAVVSVILVSLCMASIIRLTRPGRWIA